jgi:hypothetical protein
MSRAESIEPLDPREGGSDPPPSSKPDWLVGSDDVTRDPDGARRQGPPPRSDRKPYLELVREDDSPPAPEDSDDDSAEVDAPPAAGATGKGAWKAAASSVPRLRQQPAAARQPDEQESFAGFAQDAMMANAPAIGSSGSAEMAGADGGKAAMPLAQAPPFWIDWLERLGSVPRPVMIGAGVVLVLGLMVYLLYPRGTPGVSLAQIQQHPEAYTGRSVLVKGKAGESFSVGGSYVYNLYQGRDSIVVYSRTTPPRLRERVKVEGTVSIGYLDGVPRVALLESQSTP